MVQNYENWSKTYEQPGTVNTVNPPGVGFDENATEHKTEKNLLGNLCYFRMFKLFFIFFFI